MPCTPVLASATYKKNAINSPNVIRGSITRIAPYQSRATAIACCNKYQKRWDCSASSCIFCNWLTCNTSVFPEPNDVVQMSSWRYRSSDRFVVWKNNRASFFSVWLFLTVRRLHKISVATLAIRDRAWFIFCVLNRRGMSISSVYIPLVDILFTKELAIDPSEQSKRRQYDHKYQW